MVIIDLRIKVDGQWQPLDLADTQECSLEEIAKMYDGKEVVFKYDNQEGIRGYFCGTGALVKDYTQRGFKAVTFAALLERPHAGVRAAVLPAKTITDVFGEGCQLEQIRLF